MLESLKEAKSISRYLVAIEKDNLKSSTNSPDQAAFIATVKTRAETSRNIRSAIEMQIN